MQSTSLSLILLLLLLGACQPPVSTEVSQEKSTTAVVAKAPYPKIPVLNFATFHMGFSSDANTTEFDENDRKNQEAIHRVAQQLAAFKPTVILVETVPESNEALQAEYQTYLADSTLVFKNPSEIELLAYELGRLSGTQRIYGIDHKMGYNFMIGMEVNNQIDSSWHNRYYRNPQSFYPSVNEDFESLDLLDKLKLMNQDRFLDFLITVNADMLTHAGTAGNFEGADEAAKYYQRNLRMYSNLNRINLDENDRVFIIMGGSHTAFFRDFISRSPKYEMVNTFDYLQ